MNARSMALSLIGFVATNAIALSAGAADGDKWYDKTNIGGDFRYRHQYTDKEEADSSDHVNRIRLRLKLEAQVNDDVKVVTQLATGKGEITSTNQDLDEGYKNKNFELDMAYMDWKASSSTHVLAGKVKNTLFAAGGNELLWDSDLTPEGLTINWACECDEKSGYFANLGGYWYEQNDAEGTPPHADIFQYSAQVGASWPVNGNKLLGGIGYHTFSPIKGRPGSGQNTLDGSSNYVNEYNIGEIFLTYDFEVSGLKSQIYANYVSNDGPSDENTGYILGFNFGKLKEAGDWSVGYSYRETKKDAVLDTLNDSDFAGGSADSKGHRVQVQYQLAKATSTSLTYIMSERAVSTNAATDYDRGQLDFNFKF